MKIKLFVLYALTGFIVFANNLSAGNIDCSSASSVNTAITAASNGDTLTCNASGSYTWSAAVTLPSTKYITLDLAGATITLSGASGELLIEAHATGNNRVTNGNIVRGTGYDLYSGPFKILDTATGAAPIVDNINFSGSNVIVDISGQGAGLMHSCVFTGLVWAQEFLHIMGFGAENTTGWTTAVSQGSDDLFYIENCVFNGANNQDGVAWVQGYYGARVVFRYNIFNHVAIDMHGSGGAVGARWWEIYNNSFTDTTTGGANQGWGCSFRAGSGVIFNNVSSVGAPQAANIGLCEEDSGYPADYQIGRGLNNTLDPAYVWNNTSMSLELNSCDAPEEVDMVQLNRDVYASTKSGYSAFTCPHTLTGLSNGCDSAVAGTSGYNQDVTAPANPTYAINAAGSSFTVTFSEAVTHGAGGTGGWVLTSDGGAVTATYSSGAGSTALVYQLSRTVYSTETITGTYTQPTNGIEDTSGNDFATVTDVAITNNSTATAGAPTYPKMTLSTGSNVTLSPSGTGSFTLAP